jgi:hypothetical protein
MFLSFVHHENILGHFKICCTHGCSKSKISCMRLVFMWASARTSRQMGYKKLWFLKSNVRVFLSVEMNYKGFPFIPWTFFPFNLMHI